MNLYDILGVGCEADAVDIKRAYRKLARKYHPDVSTEADATERFKDVQLAYDVLSDSAKRAHYDATGEAVIKDFTGPAEEVLAGLALRWIMEKANEYGDLLAFLTAVLTRDIAAAEANVEEGIAVKARYVRAASRLKHTVPERRNAIGIAIETQIAGLEAKLKLARESVLTLERARELAADYTYTPVDPPAPTFPQSVFLRFQPLA